MSCRKFSEIEVCDSTPCRRVSYHNYTFIQIHKRTYNRTHAYTDTYELIYTNLHKLKHEHTHTRLHTIKHTYIHKDTYVYTNTYKHTHTLTNSRFPVYVLFTSFCVWPRFAVKLNAFSDQFTTFIDLKFSFSNST